MALTNGAKKFLGLVATIAVVGGGIYGYKNYAATHPSQPATEVAVQAEQAAPVEVPQPIESPVAQTRQLNDAVNTMEREDAPEPAPTQSVSSNRGLANVLNAAKNK